MLAGVSDVVMGTAMALLRELRFFRDDVEACANGAAHDIAVLGGATDTFAAVDGGGAAGIAIVGAEAMTV